MRKDFLTSLCGMCVMFFGFVLVADEPVSRWKLDGDLRNSVRSGPDGENAGLVFETGTIRRRFAKFDGQGCTRHCPFMIR